jgi:hypothetical protein
MSSEIISLNLHSSLRSSGTKSAASYLLGEQINNISALKLKSAMMPLSTPLIDSRNNKFYFKESSTGSNLTATLTSGNYVATAGAADSIANQVEAALEAASVGVWAYTVTVSTVTNCITISTTNGSFSILDGANDCYYELGLTTTDRNSLAATQTGDEPIDLSGLKVVHVVSNLGASRVVNAQFNVLGSFFVDEELNQISTFQDDSLDYCATNLNSASEITISFIDGQLRALTILKDYSLTINLEVD